MTKASRYGLVASAIASVVALGGTNLVIYGLQTNFIGVAVVGGLSGAAAGAIGLGLRKAFTLDAVVQEVAACALGMICFWFLCVGVAMLLGAGAPPSERLLAGTAAMFVIGVISGTAQVATESRYWGT